MRTLRQFRFCFNPDHFERPSIDVEQAECPSCDDSWASHVAGFHEEGPDGLVGRPTTERLARALAYADRTDDNPSRWYSGEVGYMDYEDHARAVLAGLSGSVGEPSDV